MTRRGRLVFFGGAGSGPPLAISVGAGLGENGDMKAPTFIDRVEIHVRSGRGGDGAATFRREKFVPFGGPDGGDGGKGGDVWLEASHDADSLLPLYYRPHWRAEHGRNGMHRQCAGRNGADCVIRVPCGTEVRDAVSGEWIGELLRDGERLLAARGGRGGRGNVHFKTSTNQAPRQYTPGEREEDRKLRLELKLISDVGLVGYPNAGKSTLLSRLSAARPKIAPYPFTTLHPVIGTVAYADYRTLRVADIPGLIAGAHRGAGLGHEFLRHIERTRSLALVIDLSGREGPAPADVYFSLLRELEMFNPDLLARPRIVVANKMDLPEARERWPEFARRTGATPLPISATTGEGVEKLKETLYNLLLNGNCRDGTDRHEPNTA